MQNSKKQKESQLGLWPAGPTKDGLQKSILYYNPNRMTTHDHLNRFLQYLDFAELPGALAVLTKVYFAYQATPGVPELLDEEEKDELTMIMAMFADMARAEGKYLAKDRQQIMKDCYQQPGERSSDGN